jgi:hypothetical protein
MRGENSFEDLEVFVAERGDALLATAALLVGAGLPGRTCYRRPWSV